MRWLFLFLLLPGCSGLTTSENQSNSLRFDTGLWQAARETITAFSLAASDPVDGTIETGWGGPPDLEGQQYKLLIRLDYTTITSRAVALTARHRLQAGDGWLEVDPDVATGAELADAIEKRAEELHLRENPVTR